MAEQPLLSVEHVSATILSRRGAVRALNDVSLTVKEGEFVGIAGESGCGKSTLCHAISRSLSPHTTLTGRIVLAGADLYALSEAEMRGVRGRQMSMILQNPLTSLDPVFRIGDQISEILKQVVGLPRDKRVTRTLELLEQVHIPDPARRAGSYPHQLSGGMRQRVVTAMATAPRPKLVLADEPTTALDVSVQEQILGLFREIREATGCAFVIVTHDLGVIRRLCDRVVIMYAGRVVEQGAADEIFASPKHPYTRALLDSLPRIGQRSRRLRTIEGAAPDLVEPIAGCAFAPRCPSAMAICHSVRPASLKVGPDASVACHLWPQGEPEAGAEATK